MAEWYGWRPATRIAVALRITVLIQQGSHLGSGGRVRCCLLSAARNLDAEDENAFSRIQAQASHPSGVRLVRNLSRVADHVLAPLNNGFLPNLPKQS